MNSQTFYSVRIDKKSWTKNKEVTIAKLESLGFKVKESRLVGDYDVFCETGKKVATLFKSKVDAAEYALN